MGDAAEKVQCSSSRSPVPEELQAQCLREKAISTTQLHSVSSRPQDPRLETLEMHSKRSPILDIVTAKEGGTHYEVSELRSD